MTNNIRNALKVLADLGVGSGPDHETETYRIERGAIRNARAALETVDAADDDEPLSARDLAMIDQAWENYKAALPVATVINDNQPGRTAIIEITIDPPTLPVGTKLYAGPKMVELAAETSPGDAYREVIDEALIVRHLGVARGNAKAELNQILDWDVAAALDPAVSGRKA